jgi:hypothetical protein
MPTSEPTKEAGSDAPTCSASFPPEWRVHTSRLLEEVLANTTCSVLAKPINIFGKLLAKVGERAAVLDDPKLNALMCMLTIYTCADPESPDYDRDLTARTISEANE